MIAAAAHTLNSGDLINIIDPSHTSEALHSQAYSTTPGLFIFKSLGKHKTAPNLILNRSIVNRIPSHPLQSTRKSQYKFDVDLRDQSRSWNRVMNLSSLVHAGRFQAKPHFHYSSRPEQAMASSLVANPYTVQAMPQSQEYKYVTAPQPPPSPPVDETSKCSLPSISSLLGLTEGQSPQEQAPQTQPQQQPQPSQQPS